MTKQEFINGFDSFTFPYKFWWDYRDFCLYYVTIKGVGDNGPIAYFITIEDADCFRANFENYLNEATKDKLPKIVAAGRFEL